MRAPSRHLTPPPHGALCMVMVSVVKTGEESGEVAGTVGHLEGHYVVRLQMYSLCSYSYTTKQRTIISRACDEILSFQRLVSFMFHDK